VVVGRVLGVLGCGGLVENTLVIFSTDHNHFFGQHGLHAKGPFHYEDMIKVPFLARHPGRIPAGKRSKDIVSLVDIAPTALGWCGLEVPYHMTGKDQSKVFEGTAAPTRNHAICEFHHDPTSIFLKTLVEERYKITVHYNREYGELHDLQEDPDELHNLWDSPAHQEIKQGLMQRFLHAEFGKESLAMPRIAGA
jgi:arylsulfatase A-like enzyme